jgi:hypothetical protein
MVTGPPGSVVYSERFESNLPSLSPQTYYEDDASDDECTPSGHSYGLSGPWMNGGLDCTDPFGCTGNFTQTRTIYFGSPSWTAADAAKLDLQTRTPLVVTFAAASP